MSPIAKQVPPALADAARSLRLMFGPDGPLVVVDEAGVRLVERPVCHGYANACGCSRCSDRAWLARVAKAPAKAVEPDDDGASEQIAWLMRSNRSAA